MKEYVIFESRDAAANAADISFRTWLKDLAHIGHSVRLFLLQNAVFAANAQSKYSSWLHDIQHEKISVLVDDVSLQERAISNLIDGAEKCDMDKIVALIMQPNVQSVWH